jgi:hypothetical protein
MYLVPTEAEQDKMKPKIQHMCVKHGGIVRHDVFHPNLVALEECDEEG